MNKISFEKVTEQPKSKQSISQFIIRNGINILMLAFIFFCLYQIITLVLAFGEALQYPK